MRDRRRSKRVHVISYLKVKEKTTDKTLGQVADITSEGLGLYGPDPLKPDTDITLKLYLLTPVNGKYEISFKAHVIWSKVGEHPGLFDSGVKLIDTREDDIEILEDFIEKSTVEDRWLSVAEMQYEE